MTEKISYTKTHPNGEKQTVKIPLNIAILKSMNVKEKGCEYTIVEEDKFRFLLHKYAPLLTMKLDDNHKLTISELYKADPYICMQVIDWHGGLELLSKIIKSYEKSFTEMYERLCEEEN